MHFIHLAEGWKKELAALEELKNLYREGLAARIGALQSAKELLESGREEARESILRIAHSLRGSGGTYGFPEITEAAKLVEVSNVDEMLPQVENLLAVLRQTCAEGRSKKKGILIIEDDSDIANLLKIIVSSHDREVHWADNTAEAEKILSEHEINLILLDLVLPDIDGRNLLVRLREHPLTATTPVFILSAHQSSQIQSECIALGANAFINKPFDPKTVATAVAAELQRHVDVARETYRDALTGLPNRAAFIQHFNQLAAQMQKDRQPFSLALVDIDHFQSINQKLGSRNGDTILKSVADTLADSLRKHDYFARLSNAQFVALFPHTDADSAAHLLDMALQSMRGTEFSVPHSEPVRITFSSGVVEISESKTAEEAILAAERYLYAAKDSGRNRVLSQNQPVESSSQKVLLAEDDDLVASVVKHRLGKAGFDIDHYLEGDRAFEAAKQKQYSLVILDVKIPVMDGFELLRAIRPLSGYESVPIVMLTSMGSQKDIIRGFDLGANDYILKPFSPVELVARIQRLLKKA